MTKSQKDRCHLDTCHKRVAGLEIHCDSIFAPTAENLFINNWHYTESRLFSFISFIRGIYCIQKQITIPDFKHVISLKDYF